MQYEENYDEDIGISKINSASFINMRLHDLQNKAHIAGINGNYKKWNLILDRLWLELVGDVKPEDEEEFFKICNQFEDIGNEKNGFEKYSKEEIQKLTKQYNVLLKKQSFLQRLINKQGKGTAYRDAADDYMD